MKSIFRKINNILFWITFIIVMPLGLISFLDDILGADFTRRILAFFGFPNGYAQFWMICICIVLVFLVTVFLKVKVFKD